ncbi:MAG: response regulator [Verrucomicrobiota bacterium]
MKILAVDDTPVAQLVLAGALKAQGHEVSVASDGEEAWAALEADRSVRVVVCDWRLPRLDGLELCRRVREKREDYVSFILLTQEQSSSENLEDAYAAGVDDFLSKPVDPGRLKHSLHVAARIVDFTSEIKRLRSFIPICCYCKKVREDGDYWKQIETYISERMDTRFSHGICPDCYVHEIEPQLQKLGQGKSPR